MVSRSPSNVLRGKQTETGAKQPRPRETGVFLQLRCDTDDWQPSAVDTQLPRWLFRSSVPTPSKAQNSTLQIFLEFLLASIKITCIKGVILFFFQTDIYSCIWAPRIHSETHLGWNRHQIWTNLQRIWSHHLECVWCHDQSFPTSAKGGDKAVPRLGKNFQLL